jgi:hypothetical protein
VRFEVEGNVDEARHFIESIERNIDYSRPVFVEIVEALHQASKRQYDSGVGWKPLKLSTIDRKGNSHILVDTGKLRDAFVRAGSAYASLNIQDDSVSLVANLAYAGYQVASGRDPSQIDTSYLEKAVESVLERHILAVGGH